MHILETYALSCGLKIDKPFVFENFATVPFEKFISFHRNHYPYYQEVIALIQPELEKRGIAILQLKAKPDNVETNAAIHEGLSFGQWAYIMRHSLLHFGEDDFLFDLAGYYDVPRVILFSNTFPATTKPYWGSPKQEIILQNIGSWSRPSLNQEPTHNFVRFIPPEKIAASIMALLGIEWTPPYQTIYPGSLYRPRHDIIELIPQNNSQVNINGPIANIAVRMDYKFDEQFLISTLSQTKATIVTNKPIKVEILNALRNNINEVLYLIEEDQGDAKFAGSLSRLNLQHAMTSYLANEKLIKAKEALFETGVIHQIPAPALSKIKELSGGLEGLMYKSSKRIFLDKQEFKSKWAYFNNQPSNHQDLSPCPSQESPEFMQELEFFFIVKPLTPS
jgi:hypothetical protein